MAKRPSKLIVVSTTEETSSGDSVDPFPSRVAETQDSPAAGRTKADTGTMQSPNTGAAFLLLANALKRDAVPIGRALLQILMWLARHLGNAAHRAARFFWHLFSRGRATVKKRNSPRRGEPQALDNVPIAASGSAAPPRPKRRWSLRRKLVVAVGSCLLLLTTFTVGIMIWALNDVPIEAIANGEISDQVIVLETTDGQPLIQQGPYREMAASIDQFPEHLINAVLAVEDRRFYEHWGVDPWSITRALGRNIIAGEVREGGSTITQQLLKILYLEPDRTLRRKVQELFLSLWLESRLSKNEILTLYLNRVYLGAGATGMPAAARLYFNKGVSELTVAESAMLAGLIAAPSALSPLENLEKARERASAVLQAMQSENYLDESAVLKAQLNSAQLQPQAPALGTGSWFADWAMREAQQLAGEFRGGIQVRTTFVPTLQSIAEQSIRTVMAEHADGSGASQAAMVVLAPDGAVLAMVGGLDYEDSQFNRALAMRQPGSTFKLFTYYAALKLGAALDTRLEDRPIEIDGWSPQNIDGGYAGAVTLAEAFARSLNVATVRLGMEVGLPNIVAAARELGIALPLRETPSLILGTSEVSLLDLTGAYASVRAGMAPVEPYGVKTFQAAEGRPFTIGAPVKPSQPLKELHTQMLALLQLAVERGTGQAAALDRFAAGKTGTSQEYRDAWFIGFDENYTVGVWVGNDDNTPMDEVTGGKLPAMIWQRFMTDAVPPQRKEEQLSFGNGPDAGLVQAAPQCNIQACSRAYRSFRASDCTFQPYSGPRRICEK